MAAAINSHVTGLATFLAWLMLEFFYDSVSAEHSGARAGVRLPIHSVLVEPSGFCMTLVDDELADMILHGDDQRALILIAVSLL